MSKTILFDLDGVLTLSEEIFSVIYTKSRGYDPAPFETFFTTEWDHFVTGKRDLKEHIKNNPDLWKWDKTPDELLQYWFECEDIRNDALVEFVRSIRRSGTKCYIATEQEKYRTEYIKNIMFKNDFDGIFSTADIGYRKKDPKFFEIIVESIAVEPNKLIFFDDSPSKVKAAKSLGIDAHVYNGVEQVKQILANS
jgi:putative hydrolase of the HAD superfamily